jgi:hypothetical protein
VQNGFTFAEVADMTLPQFKQFVLAVSRKELRDQLKDMGTFRIAYHADANDYSKIVRENERNLER